MKQKIMSLIACGFLLSGCTSLTYYEQQNLSKLQAQGISIDRMPDNWEKPASPLMAGLLNVLPGGGNMYLASGNAGDSSHWIYAAGNFLTWPASILWGVPEAVIDANNINKREMLYYYMYGNNGKPVGNYLK